MGIFEKIKELFSGSGQGPKAVGGYTRHDGQGLYVYIRCDRCGEVIPLRLRKTDEMARSEEPGYEFFVQKLVMGNQCFNRMDSRIEFDRRHEVLHSDIKGGSLVTVQEYEQLRSE